MPRLLPLLLDYSTAPAQAPVTPAEFEAQQHRLSVQAYDSAGNLLGPPVQNIIACEIGRDLNAASDFRIVVPLTDRNAPNLESAAELRIYREGEGERFRGKVEQIVKGNVDNRRLITITGLSLAKELIDESTYHGLRVDAASVSSGLSSLLGLVSGWSGIVSGSGYQTVQRRYEQMSVMAAIGDLAKTAKAYWRETTTPRQIEIKNTHAASGIILTNVGIIGSEVDEASNIHVIESIRDRREERSQLVNRLVPFAKIDQDDYLDLRESDRSSPYVIGTQVLNQVPQRTAQGSTLEDTSGDNDALLLPKIAIRGTNRYMLVFVGLSDIAHDVVKVVVQNHHSYPADALQGSDEGGGNSRLEVWGIPSPAPAMIQTMNNAWVYITASGTDYFGAASIVLADVDMADAIRAIAYANGISANPSLSVNAEAGDSIFAFIFVNANTTIAGSGSGVSDIPDTYQNDTGGWACEASEKPVAGSGSNTFNWSLGVSAAWHAVAVVIKPAVSYYIEDAASVAAYGRVVAPLPVGSIRLTRASDKLAIANSLYDYAVQRLQELKTPPVYYEGVEVVTFPGSGWLPGDTVSLRWRELSEDEEGSYTPIDVITDVVIMKAREIYESSGARRWRLDLASTALPRPSDAERFVELSKHLIAVQAYQV